MEKKFANLHFHSTHSDGVYSPAELVAVGKKEGYQALVLTDHDVATGVPELIALCKENGMDSMVGTEFTCEGFGQCFHMLGFDFDPQHHEMAAMLRYLSDKATFVAREQFNYCIEKGYLQDITWEEVVAHNPGLTWFCNEPVFRTMKAKGQITDTEYWGFFKHFREYSPKFNPYRMPTAETMIGLIRAAGGVPVLAHPHEQIQYVEPLIQMGLMGVECSHEMLTEEEEHALRSLAKKHGLYTTGGSDHHGFMGGIGDTRYASRDNPYAVPALTFGVTEEEYFCLKERKLG